VLKKQKITLETWKAISEMEKLELNPLQHMKPK
jgi:hypothetical protein